MENDFDEMPELEGLFTSAGADRPLWSSLSSVGSLLAVMRNLAAFSRLDARDSWRTASSRVEPLGKLSCPLSVAVEGGTSGVPEVI